MSIDVGVMEKVQTFHVVPGSFGWSDLGSWETAWDLSNKDAAGNVANELGVVVDARNNLLLDLRRDGKKRVIAAVGVEDLVHHRDRRRAPRHSALALPGRARRGRSPQAEGPRSRAVSAGTSERDSSL